MGDAVDGEAFVRAVPRPEFAPRRPVAPWDRDGAVDARVHGTVCVCVCVCVFV